MKTVLTTLAAILGCVACTSTAPLGADDVQMFPLASGVADEIEFTRSPVQEAGAHNSSPMREIAAGLAFDPAPAEDAGGADQLDLEERVVKLEGQMETALRPNHSIALVFSAGQAEYDDDLDPVDESTAYQLDLLLGPSGGLGMEFTAAYAYEKDEGIKLWNATAAAGFRYTLGRAWFQPYVAAGYEFEYAKYDTGKNRPLLDDHSYEYGPYVRGGFNVSLGQARRWFVGADYRYGLIGGEHDFGRNFEPDADYVRILAFVGFRF
jgi:opacity protein-like surface antigen